MIPCKVINSRELILVYLLLLNTPCAFGDGVEEANVAAEIKLYTELRAQCMRKLNIANLHEQPLANIACIDRCILEQVGIISSDGVFHQERVPPNIRHAAIGCNMATNHLAPCKRAQSYNLCVFHAVGLRVLAEVCVNETAADVDLNAMPKSMMNLSDARLRCYHRCMLIKMEKIDARNGINAHLLNLHVDDVTKVRNSVRTCEERNQQEDECEQAVRREICVMEMLTSSVTKEENKTRHNSRMLDIMKQLSPR